MKLPVLSVLAAALTLSSCTTPGGTPPPAAAANPLVGTWKFDFPGSVVQNAVYAANAGLPATQQEQTKKYLGLMDGSTVTFTPDTITTVSGTQTASMKYHLVSADPNGNVVIADDRGIEARYSVSGNTLSNSVPDYHFVAVYKRQ